MSEATRADHSLPLSLERGVDAACQRFEQACQAGQRPAIEPYLAEAPPEARTALLRELLALELAYRRQAGETLNLEDYRRRFPAHSTLLEQVLAGIPDSPVAPGEQPVLASCAARYRPVRPHARGGLGEVEVALDVGLGREVALKRIQGRFADDPEARRRFLLEAEVTGRLEHPGVVPVYVLGSYADGRPFYAMRFVRGENLKHAIDLFHASKEGFDGLAVRALLRRFLDVCNAVAYAHARGVVHRDIKPANVMLGEFGETLVVDWGLAKVVGPTDAGGGGPAVPLAGRGAAETAAGAAIGTPAFMSPEQAEGKIDALGPATDIYSLGATLYCALTGRSPVPGDDVAAALEKVRRGEIVPADEARRGVPRPLAAVCRKAMALRPSDRYASAKALAEDVEHWLADEPVTAYHDPALVRFARWRRKNRTLVTTASAALLVALVALTVGLAVVSGLNAKLEAANTKLDAALTEAEKERNIAVAVNKFLREDLLGQADIGKQPFLGEEGERDPNITVAELLDRAAASIEGKFPGQEETEAAIRLTIGHTYRALGKYDMGLPQLERSVRLFAQKQGADHPDTVTSKNSLAALYHDQARHDRAERLMLEVLEQREKSLGPDHPDTLTSKNNLAVLYRSQARYDKALPISLKVLEQRERKLGPDHPDTLASKNSLAVLYQDLARYDSAEPLLLEVLKQREEKLGPDHPKTLASKNNLAALYHNHGRNDKALPIYLEVLKQREEKLGADHPSTLITKNSLAALYHNHGRNDKALPIYLEVLKQREEKLGADHPSTLTTKNNLADLYRSQGRYDRAEPLLLEVLKQQEKNLGPDHPSTLAGKNNLAALYLSRAMYDRAEPLFLEVIQQQEEKLGADHPSTLTTKNNLAALYHGHGRYAKAEPLFLEVVRQRAKKLGADHPHTLASKNFLARVYHDQRRYDRAESVFLEVLRQQEEKLGDDHPDTLSTLANFGVTCLDAGRFDDAIRCLEGALARSAKRPGGLPAKVAWVRRALATSYEAAKQYVRAEPLYRAELEQSLKHFGPDDPRTAGALAELARNLLSQKKPADAEPLLRDSLRVREKARPDEWTTFSAKSLLGGALLGLKKYADATPLLVQGYDGMKQREAKIPPRFRTVNLKEALERLVTLYDALDKKPEAAKYRQELDALTKAAKGPAKK